MYNNSAPKNKIIVYSFLFLADIDIMTSLWDPTIKYNFHQYLFLQWFDIICLVSRPSHFLSEAVRAWRQSYVYICHVYISTSNNNFSYWSLENMLTLVESV